jgi:hypothetical protein
MRVLQTSTPLQNNSRFWITTNNRVGGYAFPPSARCARRVQLAAKIPYAPVHIKRKLSCNSRAAFLTKRKNVIFSEGVNV